MASSYKISLNYAFSNGRIDLKKPPTVLLSLSGRENINGPITSGVFLTLSGLQRIRVIVSSRQMFSSPMVFGRLRV